MSVTEICLVVIALSAVAVAVLAAIVATRVLPLIRSYEELAEAATRTTQRLDGLIEEVHVLARDVHQVENRVSNVAKEILNVLEPSLRTVSAVVGVLRSGLSSLLGIGHSRGRDTLQGPGPRGPES